MSASAAPRLTAVVLFPTPPFWLAIAMIRARPGSSGTTGFFFRGARFGLAGAGAWAVEGAWGWDVLAEALVTVGS